MRECGKGKDPCERKDVKGFGEFKKILDCFLKYIFCFWCI